MLRSSSVAAEGFYFSALFYASSSSTSPKTHFTVFSFLWKMFISQCCGSFFTAKFLERRRRDHIFFLFFCIRTDIRALHAITMWQLFVGFRLKSIYLYKYMIMIMLINQEYANYEIHQYHFVIILYDVTISQQRCILTSNALKPLGHSYFTNYSSRQLLQASRLY